MSTPITAAAPLTTPPIFPTPTALSAAQEVAALGGPAPGPLAVVRRHPLAVFFVLAFALSWGVEIPMEAFHVGPLQYFVGWMPGLAAILVAGATMGRGGVRALLRQLLIWRVGWQWYLLALFGFVALWAAAQALDPLLGGTGLHLPAFSAALLAGFAVQLAIRMVLSSEQLAWSGFALPRLQARHSALAASVVLGIIWACWHLPLFFVPGSQRDGGFASFLAGAIGLRIILTWLFNNTRGSVLLCTICHQAINTWTDLLAPTAPAADQAISSGIYLALLAVAIAVVVAVFGPARLSRTNAPAPALPG